MEKLAVNTTIFEWANPETNYRVQINQIRPNVVETVSSGDPSKNDLIKVFNYLDLVFEANRKSNPSGKFFHILVIKDDQAFPIINRIYAVNRCIRIIRQNWLAKSYLASETKWAYLLGLVLNKVIGTDHVKFAGNTQKALLDIDRYLLDVQDAEPEIDEYAQLSKEELAGELRRVKAQLVEQTELLAARLSILSWTKNHQEIPGHEIAEEFRPIHEAANLLERDLEHFKEELAHIQLKQENGVLNPSRSFEQNERNLRLLLGHSDEAICVISKDRIFLDFNKNLEINLLALTGMHVYRGMPMSEIDEKEAVNLLWEEGLTEAFEGLHVEKTIPLSILDQVRHFQLKFVPVQYIQKIEHVIIFQRDITERYLREQNLKEKNEFIDNLINTVPGLIYVYNHELKKTVFQSRPAQSLFTYHKKQPNQEYLAIEAVVHSNFKSDFSERQQKWLYAKDSDVLEMEFLVEDGIGLSEWVISREKVFKRNAEGKVLETIGFANSNQSKKSTEEKLVTRLLTEKIVSAASSKLIGLTLQNYVSVFDEILTDLSQHGLMDGVFTQLWGSNFSPERSFICWSEKHPEDQRIQILKGELFHLKWIKNVFSDSDFLLYGQAKEIPNEAFFNQSLAKELEAEKFLILPIVSPSGKNGVFVVFKKAGARDWHFEQIQLFILLSEMISNALEKLRYEREINAQNSKLSSILENTSDSAWSVDLNFSILTFNSSFQSSFKNTYGHLLHIGAMLEELVPEEHWSVWKSLYRRSFNGEKFNTEWVVESDIYELSFHPIVENGQVIGSTVVARNITYRSIFERKLRNSENMLTAIINNSDEMIWMVDRDLRLIKYNKKLEELILFVLQTQLEPGMYVIFENQPEENKQFWLALYSRALAGEKILQEWSLQGFIYEISINPITEGNLIKYLGVYMKNITERKKVENTILEQNEELSKVNKELDSFVYKASHDLRAPLVSMLGLINITRLEKEEEIKIAYLEMQEKSIRKLDKYIKDIIDYSRNARQGVVAEAVDLERMIDEIIEQNKFTAEAERLRLIKSIEMPEGFKTDPRRLEVVLNNLISNAIRYSDPSKPTIEIEFNLSPYEKGVKIELKDNGIGIGEEHHHKVFDMFYRATTSRTGSGLGLYIVRESVLKLGGTIQMDSKPGRGTTFTLMIPELSLEDKTA